MFGPVQLKSRVCVRRNGGVLYKQGRRKERDNHLCVSVCERERGAGALSPMPALHGLAHTAFAIRGGEEKGVLWF